MNNYKHAIIIDNDSLVNLTSLSRYGIFKILRNIFTQILIPEKVKEEYEKQLFKEPERRLILDKLRPNEGFWALCTIYDSFSKSLLFKIRGIDEGEAEIISQAEKTGNMFVISDDKQFKEACKELNKNIRIYNSLFILALLDIHGYINNIKVFGKIFKARQFRHEDLKIAYREASEYLKVAYNPKKVSRKTFILIKEADNT